MSEKTLIEIETEARRKFIEDNRTEYRDLAFEERIGNPQPTSIARFNQRCALAGLEAVAAHARKTDPTRVLLGQLLHDTRLINDGHFMSKLNEAYQNG